MHRTRTTSTVTSRATERQARDRVPFEEDALHKNRRIVMPLRQVGENGEGAVRTIVAVVPKETAEHVEPLIRQFVKKGPRVMTDGLAAYGRLGAYPVRLLENAEVSDQ